MALKNEKEIVRIITKLYQSLDGTYYNYCTNQNWNYISQLTDVNSIDQAIQRRLNNKELDVFMDALAENEEEVGKLIEKHACLDRFFTFIKACNIKPIATSITKAYTRLINDKKAAADTAKRKQKNIELYKAARLTPRQKRVLSSLGMPLSLYEKSNENQ